MKVICHPFSVLQPYVLQTKSRKGVYSFWPNAAINRGCSVTQGRKRKAQQESSQPSSGTAPAATLPVSDHRQRRQSYPSLASVHRQKKQKFIAGGDRRSVSGSDGRCFAAQHLNNSVVFQGMLCRAIPDKMLSICHASLVLLTCSIYFGSCCLPWD